MDTETVATRPWLVFSIAGQPFRAVAFDGREQPGYPSRFRAEILVGIRGVEREWLDQAGNDEVKAKRVARVQ